MNQMIPRHDPPQFVLCLRNDGLPVSLERRKVYRVLPDEPAARHGLIRIIDETDESCLYPVEYFHPLGAIG
jgi:hypothetical protein